MSYQGWGTELHESSRACFQNRKLDKPRMVRSVRTTARVARMVLGGKINASNYPEDP